LCERETDCSDLGASATCDPVDTAKSACDVSCQTSGDCAGVGPNYACEQGHCRWRPRGSTVGQPCIPSDESRAIYSGSHTSEVMIEDRSDSCAGADVCLVNHFQGRVTCPYGQTSGEALSDPQCALPGGAGPVTIAVSPQLLDRRAADTVTCSCRCDGPAGSGDFCTCPNGFVCTRLFEDLGLGADDLAGSYCVKDGTVWEGSTYEPCNRELANCE
jgi:hypothetical protein